MDPRKLFSVLLPGVTGLTMLLPAKMLWPNQQFCLFPTSVPFLALWAGILKGGGRGQNVVENDRNVSPSSLALSDRSMSREFPLWSLGLLLFNWSISVSLKGGLRRQNSGEESQKWRLSKLYCWKGKERKTVFFTLLVPNLGLCKLKWQKKK